MINEFFAQTLGGTQVDDDIIELHLENAKTFLLDEEFRDRIIANSQELVKTRTLQSTHDKYIEIINESITKE